MAFKKLELLKKISDVAPWFIVVLIIQIQLLFLKILPAKQQHAIADSGIFVILNLDFAWFLGFHFYKKWNSFESCSLICLFYAFGASMGFYRGEILFENWFGTMFVLTAFYLLLQTYLILHSNEEFISTGLKSILNLD